MPAAPLHPFLDALDAALAGVVPREPVALDGAWSRRTRRAYASSRQIGTGAGPFVDVVDHEWAGTLRCASAIGCLAFLRTADELHWVKAPQAALELPVRVSLTGAAGWVADRAMFGGGVGGAGVPGVDVPATADLGGVCPVAPLALTTGRVARLAHAGGAWFLVVLFPCAVIAFGRCRLWRLREDFCASLPPDLRSVLTRRRSGVLRTTTA
jgi:hypothetical protein